MRSSTLRVPPFDSTPLNADSALEPFFGSARRSIDATTSSAFSTCPLWNFTFGRSLKVQTVPSSFGFHDKASIGRSIRSAWS